MTLHELLKITKGKIVSGEKKNKEIGKICIDSRIIEKNDTFITIKGNKIDSYIYIKDIINVASAVITNKKIKLKNKTPIIKVKNTKKAITQIGKYNRKKYIDKPLIGITGSVGKTTTKDLLYQILKTQYNVLKTKGNYNNQLGVPIMLSQINDKHDIIILEFGMNHLKEIEKLSKISKPTTCIITNIGTSHIGNLKTQENILKAKMEIIKGMKKGNLIINGNDFYLNKIKNNKKYSIIKTDDKNISNITLNEKLFFDIDLNNKIYNIEFNIPNKYLIDNILLSIEAAQLYKISNSNIIKAINNFKAPEERLEIINIKNNITIINDCYNASLESIKSSLSVLNNTKKKKLIILGDILELGHLTEIIHKKIQEELEKIKDLQIITIGDNTKIINLGTHFNNNQEIKNYLDKIELKDTTILIKGSHNMHLNEIKDHILKINI